MDYTRSVYILYMKHLHSLKLVTLRTGLSPQLIRVWEKRYQAVTPTRTPTNRRLYTEEDVERLDLLHQLTRKGHGISQIARLPAESLRVLLQKDGEIQPMNAEVAVIKPAHFYNDAIAAIQKLDSPALATALQRCVLDFGYSRALQEIAQLIESVGEQWRNGGLRIAHEHLATATIRVFLSDFIRASRFSENAPLLTVATPAEQHHDLGAMLTAAVAHNNGWRVTYLGASLPSEEIAGAAVSKNARAVGLSIVYPGDDPNMERELETLRKLLPAEVVIIVGGRAAASYQAVLERIDARIITTLQGLYEVLDDLRR